MLFSDHPRSRYAKAPVHEVICQLRFPDILSINTTEPAAFQEAIRAEFPRYTAKQEAAAPKIVGAGGPNPQVEQAPPTMNYNFLSTDNVWKINLTRNFIALSTLRYNGWKDFARRLDRPLAEFIRLYNPAFFERIGLRYVNILSRKTLGLEGRPWAELMAPVYTGVLAQEDVREETVANCAVDFTLQPDSSSHAKVHAGPGRIKSNNPNVPADEEQKFILDIDLSMGGNVSIMLSAGALETLHGHADRLFEGALTDSLRAAMDPQAE